MNTSINKVICVGWHKTGTTSMGEALLVLGYKVVGARLDLADPLLRKDLHAVLELAKKFNAFQDVPWAALYKELDKTFPNSKFILTTRNEDKWLESAKRHFGSLDIKLHEWLYGVGVLDGNEQLYLKRYRKHNEDVLDYFKERPEDLLVIPLEKGMDWDTICQFLNQPKPMVPFPFANKGKQSLTKNEKIYNHFRNLIPLPVRSFLLKLLGRTPNPDRFNNHKENTAYIRELYKNHQKINPPS